MTHPFRIVTHKGWLAEQFAGLGGTHDWGWDIDPDTAMDTIWWAPGAWVASAFQAGITLPLLSAGPAWLDRIPDWCTGRKVHTMTLSDIPTRLGTDWDDQVFVKLPEAKLDRFPARLHTTKYLADSLRQYHLPPDTYIQIQNPMRWHMEARFWIAHSEIEAESFYRIGNDWWGSPDFTDYADMMATFHSLKAMHKFAQGVADEVPTPPGYVLDIGITDKGEIFVIEANAAWSSGPYDGHPGGILKAITAAHDFCDEHPEWAWQPNPVFETVSPLKIVHRGNP